MNILRWLDKYFEPTLIVITISLMTLILGIQVLLRPFDLNIAWAEELARYLFVWAMYLSISYCIRDDRHIRIRIFIDKLPLKYNQLMLVIADLFYLAFSSVVTWYGYHVIARSLKLGQIAPALEIPVAVLYCSVVICAAISVIRLLINIYKRVHVIKNEFNKKQDNSSSQSKQQLIEQ
ncbi:TRAP transporter small permease [Vibrio sp. SS-MA-C1-2]|uniref:TRAP transporter small permease n=1 Tax=Vibrio sp. SS-MA-C1-2 TaxID=2908646 RepID=UPI001F2D90F3|nr:TRAP transporter small permease [Vibrio sp. SS-MA-C1-2]UJF17919.1 TRAP transporter small permease [Vibrio sp. SS-MA-C1-2]